MTCVHHDPPPITFVGSMADITELKHIEAALRVSEGRFRAIVEQGFDVVVVLDADLRVSYVSPAARRLGGYADSGIGKPAHDFIHTEDVTSTLEYYRAILADEAVRPMQPVRVITVDGRLETLEIVARKLEDEGTGGIVAVGRIVTDRVEAEAALRASEARFRDQASILEMIATSTPRSETLAEICRMVESQLPGVRCSVLLVDETGMSLVHGAAPSFPASFVQAIDGLPIAEGSGVCGTAAATGKTVVREDILADPGVCRVPRARA